jgi:hypothetical protein
MPTGSVDVHLSDIRLFTDTGRRTKAVRSSVHESLGNFALASVAAHDWAEATSQLQEGLQTCVVCSALPTCTKVWV